MLVAGIAAAINPRARDSYQREHHGDQAEKQRRWNHDT
jgi:hypothetical protein